MYGRERTREEAKAQHTRYLPGLDRGTEQGGESASFAGTRVELVSIVNLIDNGRQINMREILGPPLTQV